MRGPTETPDTQWPFAGRLVHALGDELLDWPWLCLRTRTGLGFRPRGLGTPLPVAARDLLEPYRVSNTLRDAEPEASGPILGIGTPPRLSARPGILLSDHLLMQVSVPTRDGPVAMRDLLALPPALPDLLALPSDPRRGLRATHDLLALPPDLRRELLHWLSGEFWIGGDWLTHLMRVLYSELFRSESTLSGLRWPPTPEPDVVAITAATLPGWRLDLATNHARLIGTDTFLHDLCRLPANKHQTLPTLDDLKDLADPAARVAVLRAVSRAKPALRTLADFLTAVEEQFKGRLDGRPSLFRDATDRQLRQALTDFNHDRFGSASSGK